jgi:hypothetical protein
MLAHPTRERQRSSCLQATPHDANVVRRKQGHSVGSGAAVGRGFGGREPLGPGDQLGAGRVEAGDEAQERARRRVSGSCFELPDASLRNPRAQRDGFLRELKLLAPFAQGDAERTEELGRIWHRATLIGNPGRCNVVYVVHGLADDGAAPRRDGAVHTGS